MTDVICEGLDIIESGVHPLVSHLDIIWTPPLDIFVSSYRPCGWDSQKKLSILTEGMAQVDHQTDYESVIRKPAVPRRAANRDMEITAEEDQDFFGKCQSIIGKGRLSALTIGNG